MGADMAEFFQKSSSTDKPNEPKSEANSPIFARNSSISQLRNQSLDIDFEKTQMSFGKKQTQAEKEQ